MFGNIETAKAKPAPTPPVVVKHWWTPVLDWWNTLDWTDRRTQIIAVGIGLGLVLGGLMLHWWLSPGPMVDRPVDPTRWATSRRMTEPGRDSNQGQLAKVKPGYHLGDGFHQ